MAAPRPVSSGRVTRRGFLRVTAIAGGGLLVACGGSSSSGRGGPPVVRNTAEPGTFREDPVPSGEQWTAHAFIRIAANSVTTIVVGPSEIGQGTMTALPQIVADELDADWDLVNWEQSPVGREYGNPAWQQIMITAASYSVRGLWDDLRSAGASVREMLISAAATRWGVAADSLRTENSFVIDDTGGRRASYGELASDAAAGPIPSAPTLKNPADYRLIGESKRRLDGVAKVNGSQVYGFDLKIPDMRVAMVARPPRFGSTVSSFDASQTLQVPGVISVHEIATGVAVLATDFWSAQQGRKALIVNWDDTAAARLNSADLRAEFDTRNSAPGQIVRNDGSLEQAQFTASESLEQDFYFPYLTHAPMEPLNTIIDYAGGATAEIWCGSQWPDFDRTAAAGILGIPEENIVFNTLLAGGGFGRRATLGFDYMIEAARVADAVRVPVKVVWDREDDITGGYYRPTAVCKLQAHISGDGEILGWGHRVASQTIFVNPVVETGLRAYEEEVQTTQGAVEMPYAIPNVRVDSHSLTNEVTVLWVRSVSNAVNVYAVETFFDRIARTAGRDPYEFRRELLQNQPRHLAVLEAAANAAGWESAPAAGVFRGMAVFASYESVICQVIEVSVSTNREVTVHRVVSAVDVGIPVNPDLVIAQIESGIVFGLSAALFGEITLVDGLVQQSNFDDYPVLRMYQTPVMETVLVNNHDTPGGAGELGVPAVAPALANALSAATGEFYDSLPLKNHGLVFP